MLHYQGLSTGGPDGTRAWLETARRFMAARDSFSLPACYGDCWSNDDYGRLEFFKILRDDWNWPAGQFAVTTVVPPFKTPLVSGPTKPVFGTPLAAWYNFTAAKVCEPK